MRGQNKFTFFSHDKSPVILCVIFMVKTIKFTYLETILPTSDMILLSVKKTIGLQEDNKFIILLSYLSTNIRDSTRLLHGKTL